MLSTQTPDNLSERRRQMTVSTMVLDTFKKSKYWNVFECVPCSKFWLGKDLERNEQKQHVCRACAKPVEDITETQKGKDFRWIVAPELGKG